MMVQDLGVVVTAEGPQDTKPPMRLDESVVHFHGDWLLRRRGRLLLVGHGRLKMTVEWNCAGWGAAFVTVNDECFSLYSDGRLSKARAIRENPGETCPDPTRPLEDDYQVLNVIIERQGEMLQLKNEISDVTFLLNRANDRVLYESPFYKGGETVDLLERLLESGAPEPRFEVQSQPPEMSENESVESSQKMPVSKPVAESVQADNPRLLAVESRFTGEEVRFILPFEIDGVQRQALEALAREGTLTAQELKKLLGRRPSFIAQLQEDLIQAGLPVIQIRDDEGGRSFSFAYEELG